MSSSGRGHDGSRTWFGPALLLGLGGSALAAVGAGQGWASATTRSPALRTAVADGADVAPAALPLALVALAAWGTVLVLRRAGRRVVASLGLLAALGAAAAVLRGIPAAEGDAAALLRGSEDVVTTTTAWPWVALAGCVLAAAGFVVALLRARSWPEMSARYDAPAGAAGTAGAAGAARTEELSDAELWRALDEGHDPTA